jgi:DNA-binding MarR family transcriptional regulator
MKIFLTRNFPAGKPFSLPYTQRTQPSPRGETTVETTPLDSKIHKILTDIIEDIAKNTRKGIESADHLGEEMILLNVIGNEGTCNMKRLTEELGLPPSTATRQVTRLVELGFVKRTTPPDNRRTVHLSLTPEGEERYRLYRKQHTDVFKLVLHELSQEEQEVLVKALEKIYEMRLRRKNVIKES